MEDINAHCAESIELIVDKYDTVLTRNKLIKIHFLADFFHYKQFEELITKCTYVKSEKGIYCSYIRDVITKLDEDDRIEIQERGFMTVIKQAQEDFEPAILTRHEKETITEICERYTGMEEDELSNAIETLYPITELKPQQEVPMQRAKNNS